MRQDWIRSRTAPCLSTLLVSTFLKRYFRAPLEIYHNRDESNFDFEQGDSAHRRAVSPSCTDQRRPESKVIRSERLAACCALAAISAHARFPEVPFIKVTDEKLLEDKTYC